MVKMKIITLFALLFIFKLDLMAQPWDTLGYRRFSDTIAGCYQFLALGKDEEPYVAYADYRVNGKATVKRFNGSTWDYVGSQGFTNDVAEWLSIVIDNTGTPYVVFRDCSLNYRATVMKYNGVSWVNVGSPGISAGEVECTRIAVDASGTPYVVYIDFANGKKTTVKKYNGTSWVNVGSGAISTASSFYPQISIGSDSSIYVAFNDASCGYKATVMKFNGISWEAVGAPGFSYLTAHEICMVLDSNNHPYLSFQDGQSNPRITVMNYDGTNWSVVGSRGISANAAQWPAIALDVNGKPYVSYNDGSMRIKKYEDSSWVTAGDSFNINGAYCSLAIDRSGNVYLASIEVDKRGRVTVLKMQTLLPPVSGAKVLCLGQSTELKNDVTGGIWSSSNNGIATIDDLTGLAVGKQAGTAVITYNLNGRRAFHHLRIDNDPAKSQILMPTECIFPGDTTYVTNAVVGGNWSSLDPNIARITSKGLLTAISGGAVRLLYSVTNSCGHSDSIFDVSICSPVTIDAFPVPNMGAFHVKIASQIQEDANVTITNRHGMQVLKTKVATNKETELHLDVPAGIYFLRAVTTKGENFSKIVLH